ncbi:MAG: carbohydrate-binding domain-containing protein, partial [Lachnospiraceae bacterium]|nr:carbohydrate-binding domain-containing protein [Lachnospiraceae bacterium]
MEENKNAKLILVISIIALLAIVGVVVAFVLIGGDKEGNTGNGQNTGNEQSADNGNKNNQTGNQDNTQTALDISLSEDMFVKSIKYTNADMETEESYSASVVIDLNNGSPKCANSSVKIDGTTVTILAGGKYTITGTMEEGQILVSPGAADENNVKIMLDGV